MKLRLLCCLPVLAVFVLVSAASVFAASASNNLTVQANVKANCTIGAGTINFGDYDPAVANAAVPLDGDTTFTIRCTKGTAATIELGPGGSHDGSTRRMSGGGDFLAYELYRVAGRAAADVWSTGGAALNPYQGEPGDVAPNSGNRIVNVYGRIPAGQVDAKSGLYTDIVVATINF